MAGIFVVLEGIEGSGKSTQAKLLAEWLTASGIAHLHTREPGGTALGEQIRTLLLHSTDMPALMAGSVVIADRFDISTLAYQGYGRGLPLEDVRAANRVATGGLTPDLVLLLDAPQSVGIARRAATRPGEDRIESAGRTFHDRVSEAYRLLAREGGNVHMIDATRPVDDVQSEIRDALRVRFPETFG